MDAGIEGYRAAEELATREGNQELARVVKQKLYLESARFALRRGDRRKALIEVEHGIQIEGRPTYRRGLKDLRERLRS